MPVLVVHIRHMRVHMALRCVLVPVAVRAGGHVGMVGVLVVAVVCMDVCVCVCSRVRRVSTH